jgi:cell shape-determining protein MreC
LNINLLIVLIIVVIVLVISIIFFSKGAREVFSGLLTKLKMALGLLNQTKPTS